jgi:hypothetical protein
MNKYRILIEGKNFIINIEGKNNKLGFITTRWVEARTEAEAEKSAIELIRNDPQLKDTVLNKKDDQPMLYAEEIVEIKSFEGVNPPGAGYGFYPQED